MNKLIEIKKITDKWYEDRRENDWDTVNQMLSNIRKLVNKK